MNFNFFLLICNYLGTIAFAASGTVKGFKHRLDILGFTLLAIITACGGGILRDIMLTQIPTALIDPSTTYLAILVSVFMYIFFIKNRKKKPRDQRLYLILSQANLVFDAIGLAIFALIGASKGLELGMNLMTTGILATLTGVGGGIIRDLLVNEIPIVLKADVYALLAFLAGISYHICLVSFHLPEIPVFVSLFFICLLIRLLVIRYKLNLPGLQSKKNKGKAQ